MHQDAFIDYAARYLLIPGQCSTAQEIIDAVGIDSDLPKVLCDLIEFTDHLKHKNLVLTESDSLLVQWNPFSGMTPIISEHAFGVGAFDDHRWLQSMHNSGVKVLYDLIHECVHAIWAAFGLCGGLKLIPIHKHNLFHTLAEACAVYMSDIEGHEALIKSKFFKDFWPSGEHRSHAISFSALQSLEASGIDSTARADWLFSIYLDGERSLPSIPDSTGLKAEALAFLIEESNYSEKIDLYTTPQWLRYYWGREEILEYISDFIPEPSFILADGKKLETFEDLRQSWREILSGESWFNQDDQLMMDCRLTVQRKALKVCELISVFSSHRLKLNMAQKEHALVLLRATRTQLLNLFNQLITEPKSAKPTLVEKVESITADLIHSLRELSGSILVITHPYLDAIPFADACPELKHDEKLTRDLAEIIRCYTLICNESLSAFRQLKGESDYTDLKDDCESIYLAAQAWIAKLNLDHNEEILLQAQQDLNTLVSDRKLPLVYPINWLSAAPFIEPLIGFRYR